MLECLSDIKHFKKFIVYLIKRSFKISLTVSKFQKILS